MRWHWLLTASEWALLLPLWRRVIKDQRWRVAAAVGTGLLWLIVIIAIVTGRQLACNATTHAVGLLLIWAGIVAVAALDWWALARMVRR